jgi:hypothetical protein
MRDLSPQSYGSSPFHILPSMHPFVHVHPSKDPFPRKQKRKEENKETKIQRPSPRVTSPSRYPSSVSAVVYNHQIVFPCCALLAQMPPIIFIHFLSFFLHQVMKKRQRQMKITRDDGRKKDSAVLISQCFVVFVGCPVCV